MRENPAAFFLVPDRFKTQKMCIMTLEVDLWQLNYILDFLKTQKMCDGVVRRDPYSLQFVPDWFVAQEQIKICGDDDDYHGDDEIIEWRDGYQICKVQKAKIKEELLSIAWHLDVVMDWCMSKDVNRRRKQQIVVFKII